MDGVNLTVLGVSATGRFGSGFRCQNGPASVEDRRQPAPGSPDFLRVSPLLLIVICSRQDGRLVEFPCESAETRRPHQTCRFAWHTPSAPKHTHPLRKTPTRAWNHVMPCF